MFEVDFLPVENEDQDSEKSGDAIAVRFTCEAEQRPKVMVIDGGLTDTGEKVVDHIRQWYQTETVDLMISTHPDGDHLNGLATIKERLTVKELLIHQPRQHTPNLTGFSNLDALDNLIKVAAAHNVTITEPFTGLTRFGGQVTVLNPTVEFYEQLLQEQLSQTKASALAETLKSRWIRHIDSLFDRNLSFLPNETLTEAGETSPRNNSSVITLLKCDHQRMLFTGDAGVPALEAAADEYESTIGFFYSTPLSFFQAPHHGSRRNVGPTILNRILGKAEAPHSSSCVSFISSAKSAPKHPSPKVVNALTRRGCSVNATEGQSILHGYSYPPRLGWVTLAPLPPLVEDGDED